MWYCGSLCAGGLWRYILPNLTRKNNRFVTCQTQTRPRLIILSYFWIFEAFFGLLAFRSLNYVNEEARDKITPIYDIFKMRLFSLLRNFDLTP